MIVLFSSTVESSSLHYHHHPSNHSSSFCLFDSQLSMSVGEMIATILETLPVGFRFYPTDEELVDNHLKLKILGMDSPVDIIPEVDICKWEPWELPGKLILQMF